MDMSRLAYRHVIKRDAQYSTVQYSTVQYSTVLPVHPTAIRQTKLGRPTANGVWVYSSLVQLQPKIIM